MWVYKVWKSCKWRGQTVQSLKHQFGGVKIASVSDYKSMNQGSSRGVGKDKKVIVHLGGKSDRHSQSTECVCWVSLFGVSKLYEYRASGSVNRNGELGECRVLGTVSSITDAVSLR